MGAKIRVNRLGCSVSSSLSLLLGVLVSVGCLCIAGVSGQASQAAEVGILIRFKESLEKETELPALFNSWKKSDASACKWEGVKCDPSSGLVAEIDLSSQNIPATVPSMVCELSGLESLKLGDNMFGGSFPEHLFQCSALQSLNLSLNYFVGDLPNNISMLGPSLKHLDLCGNNFSGEIPPGFGELPKLITLNLTNNLLNGTVPGFLGKLSSLQRLDLAYNPLKPGPIPEELGNLSQLRNLILTTISLNGEIPESLGKLQLLDGILDLSMNKLSGTIPASIFNLPKLKMLELYNNQLSGEIPSNIFNLTSITDIDISMNMLNGSIPQGITQLKHLTLLNLWENELVGPIPEAIQDIEELYQIRLFKNHLSGMLPQKLGMNGRLKVFDVSNNQLEGPLPPGLCNSGMLVELIFFNNNVEGRIPDAYGSCPSLERVMMNGNKLNGSIPSGFWNTPHAYIVDLSDNRLSGTIGPDIAKCSNLTTLNLSGNQFSGPVPHEIGQIPNLTKLILGNNMFEGPLPSQLGQLSELNVFFINNNKLRGQIPEAIGMCKRLAQLNLAGNMLTGTIPGSIADLPGLTALDLSRNGLTGAIPPLVGDMKFDSFNISYNRLSGRVPEGLVAFESGFIGNPELCSSTTRLLAVRPCSAEGRDRSGHGRVGFLGWVIGATFAAAALLFFVGSCLFFKKYRHHFKANEGKKSWSLTSFHKLPFNQIDVIDSLDEDNVIGSGGAGKVYLSKLSNGQAVAVKKLWTVGKKGDEVSQRSYDRSFKAEVDTLGKLRHKNIVKLLFCYSCDDEKFLVYDYMENGSLGDLLHSSKGGLILDWPARHKIALGAAEGLAYLHHDYKPQVLHCDVKSNNILLDADFEPHVADFGLARIIQGYGTGVSMTNIAGTYGYIAPEYAYTLKVTEKSDIYSFGVVLLELVTGKRPIESEFGDGVDIVKWVCDKIQARNSLTEIFDSRIPPYFHEDMMLMLRVGLLCTSALPLQRPSMKEVVQMLVEARPKDRSGKGSSKEQTV